MVAHYSVAHLRGYVLVLKVNFYVTFKMHLPKRPRQTAQTQIRLLLKKQSVQVPVEHSGSVGRAFDWGLKGC